MRNLFSTATAALIAMAACSQAQSQPVNRNDPWRPEDHPELAGLRAERRAIALERKKLMQWPDGLRVLRNLDYVPNNHESAHKLDIFIPENKTKNPLTLIVHVHGGGWSAGDKEQEHLFIPLLNRGYAVATINYRLSHEALWPAQIYDCKAAIRWLREHAHEYGYDPNKIGVWGESAGGHLVAMLGTTSGDPAMEGNVGDLHVSSKVQAVCDWFGPTDLVTLPRQSELAVAAQHSGKATARGFTEELLGGRVEDHKAEAKQASPITYVTSSCPPFLIMHGDRDTLVPPSQSQELYDALRAKNVDATFKIVAGAGHAGAYFQRYGERKMVWEFFDAKLKGVHSIGSAQTPSMLNHAIR